MLQPSEQRGGAAARDPPYHASLEGLAEKEILQAEEESAGKERMSYNLGSSRQLTSPPIERGSAEWQSLHAFVKDGAA